MGDLVYDYLTLGTQGDFVPYFYSWLDYPSLIGRTSGVYSPPLDYGSEQHTPGFPVPSSLYVAEPPRPLYH